MKKLMAMTILAVLILMGVSISFAVDQDISNEILAGTEKATPSNWDSDQLVWKTGIIDFVDSDGVVIEDTRYRFSNGIHFFSINGTIINSNNFNQGTEVTFVLDSDRRTIVTLIKDKIQE